MRNKNIITIITAMILISIVLLPVQNVSAYFEEEVINQEIQVATDDIVYETNVSLHVDDETLVKELVNDESTDVDITNVSAVTTASGIVLTQKDIYDLARIVHGEARGEPFVGQVAIAAVVLNRLKSDKFGNTVQEIIYEPGAFTAVADGQYYLEPNATAYQAVEAAIKGWDPTGGAIYYWNPVTATNKWVWSRPIINQIGKHVFAL